MQTNKRPPLYVIVACVLSAIACGCLCWNFTLRSDAEATTRDYLFLLLYLCLSLMSYLGGLWFFARLSRFQGTEVLVVLFLVSVFGTTAPYVASSAQIWTTHSLELAWFLRQSAVAWVLYNVGMLVFMTVVATVTFIVTLPFRPTTRNVAGV